PVSFLVPLPRRPTSPLFPYTTLFRSVLIGCAPPIGSTDAGISLATHVQAGGQFAEGDLPVDTVGYLISSNGQGAWTVAWTNPSRDRKSTRLNSSHVKISYAVFCLKKK